ncbi:MAG TPA: MerR family transcriptional regulator [Verrucomicrobiales bacterium]|nr:MerR family transcriptional regulator [Verrucomicrobiales bacterium]
MKTQEEEFYEISAVARLTGVSPHVLRVWERRYGVVEPGRSDSKRRRYTQDDIQRLTLLKTLVDHGHAIGSVARLATAQLEERLASALEARPPDDQLPTPAPFGVCRIGLIGVKIREAVCGAVENSPAMRIVGEFQGVEELLTSLRPGAIDLIIVERDTIFPEDLLEIQEMVAAMRVRRAILVYQFAREDTIQPLDIRRITALRAPVESVEIQLACLADVQFALRPDRLAESGNAAKKFERPAGEVPPRAFTDEQLVKIGRVSSVVKCECPQHLSSLLAGLVAFERYSEQCEDRSEADAAIHAYLHRITAQCRANMENALSEILTQEGITI